MSAKPIYKFEARCLKCGTIAVSFHHSNVPRGKRSGMASCECGALRVDALDQKGHGRVFAEPGAYELV